MIRQIIISICFICFIPNFNWAQEIELLRSEIDAKTYDYLYFIPLKTNSLITVQHFSKAGNSSNQWELRLYSYNFKKKDSKIINTTSGYELIEYYDDEDSIFYAFFGGEGNSNRFEVIKYNYLNGKISQSKTYNDQRISYEKFDIINNIQFISGLKSPSVGAYIGQLFYTLTLVPIINGSKVFDVQPSVLIKFPDDKSKNIILDLKGESEILSSKIDKKSGNYGLVIRNTLKRKTTFHYYEIDQLGDLKYHNILEKLGVNNLLTGQLVDAKDASFSFIGTYNEDPHKRSDKGSNAIGMYVSKILDGKESMVKFHSFSDFKNAPQALDFHNRKRFEDSQRKGDTLDFGFKLLVHENVLQFDSSYVVLAERYSPEYHYETSNNIYGSIYNEQIFDGFRFSYAFAVAFDSDGNLLWDNIFSISDIISYNLEENVIVYFDGNTQVLLYYFDGKIVSKVISGNEIVYRKDESEVQTVGDNERIVYENYGKIYHWYGPYFLLTGYQIVANDRAEKRKVYFFVKIKFD